MAFIQLADLTTYYEVHGAGRPIVLVNGALTDHRMWRAQVEPFAQRYKVVTYDLRGHGQTREAQHPPYSMELFAADLRALVTGLQLREPVLCGVSLGGMVAQAYAVAYPAELSALILCDTAVSMTHTLRDKLETYLFGWSLGPSVRLIGARRFTDWAFRSAKLLRGEAWFGRDAAAREYVRETMFAMGTREMAKTYDAIIRFRGLDLTRIRVPTLVLNGEHESASVFHHAEYMRRRIPHVELGVVPGAGHTSNMENPDAFNHLVLSFLESALK
jgi:pimeloyl-ACP methyl ester carboxylesterase